jgi:3-oxoacyl-[acyl-carrier-protein] synthase III
MTDPAPASPPGSAAGGRGATIAAVGMAVPSGIVSNAEIGARLGVDDAWIRKRTGVVERRVGGPDDSVASLAADAARAALGACACSGSQVDLVLVATMTPDRITPSVATEVIERLALTGAAGADVGAACTGWLSAVSYAAGLLEAGRSECALVIGADMLSRVTDPDDRSTAPLFADGAGAALIVPDRQGRIGPIVLGTDPTGAPLIYARHDEGVIRMNGGGTFQAAVSHLVDATRAAADAAAVSLDDIDLFAYHQANGRILRAIAERLGLPDERLLVSIDRFGNTSAATIPMTLADAAQSGRLRRGARVLLGAFGAGFNWGATVVEWAPRA